MSRSETTGEPRLGATHTTRVGVSSTGATKDTVGSSVAPPPSPLPAAVPLAAKQAANPTPDVLTGADASS